jgi:hypothetical protein
VQLLLRQMLLLRGLRLAGLRGCESAADVPHLWAAIAQLRGERCGVQLVDVFESAICRCLSIAHSVVWVAEGCCGSAVWHRGKWLHACCPGGVCSKLVCQALRIIRSHLANLQLYVELALYPVPMRCTWASPG